METVRKSKKRGVSLIEIIIAVAIITFITGYSVNQYKGMKYKNAIDSDKIKILTTINNANVMSAVLPKGITVLPKYVKVIDKGIIVANDLSELEVDKGFNSTRLKNKGVSILFDCGEDKPVIKECPIAVFYPGSGVTTDNNTTIPSGIKDQGTRNASGFIEFTKGAPEKPFTIYTFDEKGIARYRIKFSSGDVMTTSIYSYSGPGKGSTGAWTKSHAVANNPSLDVEETADWKKENLKKLPLQIEIK